MSFSLENNGLIEPYKDELKKLNKIISENNIKCMNHSEEVRVAKEKLECHTIAIALEDGKYKKILEESIGTSSKVDEIQEKLTINKEKIFELERKASNIASAIPKINKHLENFFGRTEIQLGLSDCNRGYIIERDGLIAKNLSESEKTAIAFSYFIVKCNENSFNINEGIIFNFLIY